MSELSRPSNVFNAISSTQKSKNHKELTNPYAKKQFLVVDNVPEMQRAMAMTLTSFGAEKIEYAGKASDALIKLMRYDIDVVLCDFDLGSGSDGLYLLEEAKERNLLKQSCVFMIVSGERRAARVISAAELVPDDYLLKPFTGEVLADRLERAMRRRDAFKLVDEALLNHEYLSAIEACNKKIGERDEFSLDFMKLKGSLSMKIGDHATARSLYEQVLKIREMPWAKMGLAKALASEKQIEPAMALFQQVVADNDRVMEAYDWLAKLYQDKHDLPKAQETLKRATELSPATIRRHKQLAEVAEENGDMKQAKAAFGTTLELSKASWHRNPAHYAALARTQLACGEKGDAAKTLASLRRDYKYKPDGEWMADVLDSQIQSASGNAKKAEELLRSAAERLPQLDSISAEEKMTFVRACYTSGQKELGDNTARDLVRNNHDNEGLLQKLSTLFDQVGMGDDGRALIASNVQGLVDLNNTAVKAAQSGQHDKAIGMFHKALEEMPENIQLMLNLVNAIIAEVHLKGWHESHIREAYEYLQKARQMAPANNKLQKLMQAWRQLIEKHDKREFLL